MKRTLFTLMLGLAMMSINAQDIIKVDIDELKLIYHEKGDKIYVVNFWATWCKPCVEELPHIEAINASYKKEQVTVLLVSLDFPEMLDKKLPKWLKKHKIKSRVIMLDDPDENKWINGIDPKWTGSIPATLIMKNSQKIMFTEGRITEFELKSIIDSNM